MVARIISILVLISITSDLFAIDPTKNGIFRIYTPDGAQGTAVVIHQDDKITYYGTAWHVVALGETSNKTVYAGYAYKLGNDATDDIPQAKVTNVDFDADIALLESPTGKHKYTVLPLSPVDGVSTIGAEYAPSTVRASFIGFASGKLRKTSGIVSFVHSNEVYSDAVVMPGMSGGAMILDDKIVGIISGGSAWYPAEDGKRNVTWPARCGAGSRLKQMLESVINK